MNDENNKKDPQVDIEDTTNTQPESSDIDDVVFETETDNDMQKDPLAIIKKLKEKNKKLEAEKTEYLNGWQRARADYANLKKQTDDERIKMFSYANKNLVEEVLPVVESFDMAMGNKEVWEKVDKNWRVGVEYIAQQLIKILEAHGVTEINPIGKTFDPAQCEAIEHVAVDKKEDDHKVLTVIKKGYQYKDEVLVPARVKVGDYKGE